MSERSDKFRQVIARVWKDENYKRKLFSDPRSVLAEAGIEFPSDYKLRIHEDTENTINIVIPSNPAESELSDEALDAVAGGSSRDTLCGTSCSEAGC